MIDGSLHRQDNPEPLLPVVMRTVNALERMRGLLGRAPLGDDEGFLIVPCASVHTIGMGYALDLVYLDRHWTVRKVVERVPPWRMSACPGAAMTLELKGGRAVALGLAVGQRLAWSERS